MGERAVGGKRQRRGQVGQPLAQLDERVRAERDQLPGALRVVGQAGQREVNDRAADGDCQGHAAQLERDRARQVDQHHQVVEPAVEARADDREEHGLHRQPSAPHASPRFRR